MPEPRGSAAAPNRKQLNNQIWALSWPMMISGLSVPLLGLVDTAVLGHLSTPVYLAAVAVGSAMLSFLYLGFNFLRMGTTGLTAQSVGADDFARSRLVVAQAMVLALSLGMGLLLLAPWLVQLGLALLQPPPEAYDLAASYSAIRLYSAPAVLLTYGISGWFIGQQNTRWPLLITVSTNLINIVLDMLLVIGLGLNSDGAAIATVIAEYSGCALALWALQRQLKQLPTQLERSQLLRLQPYRQLLAVNAHLFVRTVLLLGSFAFFTAQGAKQGEVVLAANALLLQLMMLTSFALDGIAHAAEALAGRAIGSGRLAFFMLTCRLCCRWAVLAGLVMAAFYAVLGSSIIGALSSLEPVVNEALRYLPWLVLLPLVGLWCYLLDGIFVGAAQSQAMQNSMLLSVLLGYLPLWALSQGLGNHGLWLAFVGFHAARSLTLGAYFYAFTRQQRWLQKRS
jgi:MATE family multidrug resistance protein